MKSFKVISVSLLLICICVVIYSLLRPTSNHYVERKISGIGEIVLEMCADGKSDVEIAAFLSGIKKNSKDPIDTWLEIRLLRNLSNGDELIILFSASEGSAQASDGFLRGSIINRKECVKLQEWKN